MSETKYGKHFVSDFFLEPSPQKQSTGPSIMIHHGELDAPLSMSYHCVTKPYKMRTPTHSHDSWEFLYFIGGNPENIKDFGAEVEIYMGKEQEKHIINKTTIISIPPGLLHCPMAFNKVERPIIWGIIALERIYKKVMPKEEEK